MACGQFSVNLFVKSNLTFSNWFNIFSQRTSNVATVAVWFYMYWRKVFQYILAMWVSPLISIVLGVLLLFQVQPQVVYTIFLKEQFNILSRYRKLVNFVPFYHNHFQPFLRRTCWPLNHSLFILAKSKISILVLLLCARGSYSFSTPVAFWSSTSSLFC